MQSVINHEKINAIARTVCWQQRKRNLSAMHLLGLLLGGQTNYQRSLTEMSQDLLDEGVVISKQSLDERLNEKASNFFKHRFSRSEEHTSELQSH